MARRLCQRRTAIVLVSLAAVAVTAVLAGLSVVAAATPGRVRVGRAPRHPARSRVGGTLPGSTPIGITVTLKPSDPSGLASYAAAVSDPGSPLCHRYLTVVEFRRRFGP